MAKFAAYGFNKSHSAAYGLVSYQTAYLKTFYPAEFMAAIMTCDLDNTEKIKYYIQEVKRMKFKIYPPNINRSHIEFDVPEEKAVGFGLAAIWSRWKSYRASSDRKRRKRPIHFPYGYGETSKLKMSERRYLKLLCMSAL